VLAAAWPKSGFLKWLYRVTGENPADELTSIRSKMEQPFIKAGFEIQVKIVEVELSKLMILIANK
jgi:hypothetical protein